MLRVKLTKNYLKIKRDDKLILKLARIIGNLFVNKKWKIRIYMADIYIKHNKILYRLSNHNASGWKDIKDFKHLGENDRYGFRYVPTDSSNMEIVS